MEPRTLQGAIVYFANPVNCRQYVVARRWRNGVICPRCGSDSVVFQEKYNRWQCNKRHERRQFTVKTGTIFEDSPLGLDKWLTAMWLLANCKNGVSSWELSRAVKVTQKTAWFMLHRIRLAMQDDKGGKLSDEVEVDESMIGGKARNMHKGKRAQRIHGTGGMDKEVVFGLIERDGRVRTLHVDSRSRHELQKAIRENVEASPAVFSDELLSYQGLAGDYEHEVINHAVEYVNGNVHTNTMENYWSLLKRSLHGTYVSVEPFHLFRYLDEQAFRFNNRKASDWTRCSELTTQIFGKRVTYAELTGKLGETQN
jgi:transposase-like protein